MERIKQIWEAMPTQRRRLLVAAVVIVGLVIVAKIPFGGSDEPKPVAVPSQPLPPPSRPAAKKEIPVPAAVQRVATRFLSSYLLLYYGVVEQDASSIKNADPKLAEELARQGPNIYMAGREPGIPEVTGGKRVRGGWFVQLTSVDNEGEPFERAVLIQKNSDGKWRVEEMPDFD
jgi:hypothetical protein